MSQLNQIIHPLTGPSTGSRGKCCKNCQSCDV